jgi:choline dehydrogenase-like flavoprotein
MNVKGHSAYEALCRSSRVEPPAFDSQQLFVDCTQWSTKPRFSRAYGKTLREATNVTVLLHANVVELVPVENGKSIERVEFRTLHGVRGSARANAYIVCCGAIESTRLLLASNHLTRSGLGNDHGLVGRYFQEHLHINFGTLVPRRVRAIHDMFEGFFIDGCKQAPKLAISTGIQERERCLSGHGEVIFEQSPDSTVGAVKTTVKALKGQTAWPGLRVLLGAARSPAEVARLAYRYRVRGRSASPFSSPIRLGAQVETAPDPESRVALGEGHDRLGMRQLRLDWRIGELERRTLNTLLNVISDEFRRLGLGELAMGRALAEQLASAGWRDLVHDSAHHMGTARMANDPKRGVVDRNCRVHGIDNLYIGSMAVFPTSGRSSPTLTAIALSVRIADHIKAESQTQVRIMS